MTDSITSSHAAMVIYFGDDNRINKGFRIAYPSEKFELGKVLSIQSFNGSTSSTVSYITPCGVEEIAHVHGNKVEVC